MMVSLTGGLSDFEILLINAAIDRFRAGTTKDVPEGHLPAYAQREISPRAMATLVRATQGEITPKALAAFIRDLFGSAEGRLLARQYIFQEVPVSEISRRLVVHYFVEGGRAFVIPGQRSTDQETVLRGLAESMWDTFNTGKLGESQYVKLGMTWKGSTDIYGWKGVADDLQPHAELRAPLAYFYGLRYVQLKKPAEAEMFFRTALADAAPASPLQRLARSELDKLKAK